MTLMSILLGAGGGARVSISLTAASNNYDVYTNRGPSYVAGSSDITVTVAAPTVIGSSSTGAYAMLVPSTFSPSDTVTIVNNGVIQGAGGNGGPGSQSGVSGSPGSSGGNALYINRPVTITNNGTIAGGGGGGGGGSGVTIGTPSFKGSVNYANYPGGGGGGGAGTIGGSGGSGVSGGSVTSSPGSPGTSSAGGAGGAGGGGRAPSGGPGGGRGAAGTASNGSGGAAGNYIVGGSFVTWSATGTRQGGAA